MRPIFGLIFVLFNKNRYKNVPENDILQKRSGGKVMEDVKRQLCIKAFSVAEAVKSDRFFLKATDLGYQLGINETVFQDLVSQEELIESATLDIIQPEQRHIPVYSIMDIFPISTKALGKIGEGITHTLTGVYVVLTGVDTEGNHVSAFGNSDGMLDEQVIFDRAGTPGKDDLIILIQVVLKAKAGYQRSGPDAVHRVCDEFCQEIRKKLKLCQRYTEKHQYEDVVREGKKKVVLVKMVSGQGAMYDTHFLATEPSGFVGGHSIIDITGAPVLLSPNEYRDGAIRALY
jgi:D-proline reductase, prdA proprotein